MKSFLYNLLILTTYFNFERSTHDFGKNILCLPRAYAQDKLILISSFHTFIDTAYVSNQM